ncbi:hypothetical protein QUB68_00410 [Microcoleus sp. A006_D1]
MTDEARGLEHEPTVGFLGKKGITNRWGNLKTKRDLGDRHNLT